MRSQRAAQGPGIEPGPYYELGDSQQQHATVFVMAKVSFSMAIEM